MSGKLFAPIKYTPQNLAVITAFRQKYDGLFSQLKPQKVQEFDAMHYAAVQETLRSKMDEVRLKMDVRSEKHPNQFYYQFFIMASSELSRARTYNELHDLIKRDHGEHIYDRITGEHEHGNGGETVQCACSKSECMFMSLIKLDLNWVMFGSVCITKNGLITQRTLNKMKSSLKEMQCSRCYVTKKRKFASYCRSKKKWTCNDCSKKSVRSVRTYLKDLTKCSMCATDLLVPHYKNRCYACNLSGTCVDCGNGCDPDYVWCYPCKYMGKCEKCGAVCDKAYSTCFGCKL
jgi:hypothetical protein